MKPEDEIAEFLTGVVRALAPFLTEPHRGLIAHHRHARHISDAEMAQLDREVRNRLDCLEEQVHDVVRAHLYELRRRR